MWNITNMMAKLYRVSLLLCCILALASCSTGVKSLVYDGKQPLKKGDLLYHLPKTVLVVQVTYTKTERTYMEHGLERKVPATYSIDKPVAVSTMQVNDPQNLYILRGGNGTNIFDVKDVDLALNDRGLLTNLQTETPDATAKTIADKQQSYHAVYRTSTQSAPALDLDKEQIKKNLSAAYKKLSVAIADNNEKLIKKHKNQITHYNELIDTYTKYNKVKVAELEMTYTYYIDPSKMEWVNNNLEYTLKANDNSEFPDLTLVLTDVAQLTNNTANVKVQGDNGKFLPINGILYYLPAAVRTQVFISNADGDNHITFDRFMDYTQFGNMGVVPIKTGGFAKRNTQLQFSAETGTLVSYSTGGNKTVTPKKPATNNPQGPIFVPNGPQQKIPVQPVQAGVK